ncbi:MAG TPA: FixH family protein [Burkholderiales bacterium]|jgi:hypothetical protein|nr:FixH family protein [Burkholderiales bacterium]
MHTTSPIRWYREPWPWLLMAGPVGVVAAGVFTTWIAFTHEDGLVADDYYKQGLAINRVIARDAAAAAGKVAAQVRFSAGTVHVRLSGDSPRALVVSLVHPTRSGLDRVARLEAAGGGAYEGVLEIPVGGRWHVMLGDADGRWRLTGEWSPAQGPSLPLTPALSARP